VNLNEIVQGVLDDYETTDPDELAMFAVGRVPEYERDRVLRQTMTTYIRSFISRNRGTADAPVARMVAAGVIAPAVKIPGRTGAFLFDRAEVERVAKELAA